MRVRAVLLVSITCGALIAFAGAASALQIGPVDVPLTVPPIPVLTPVVGSNPVDLPDASVNVTPDGGLTVGVSVPDTIGPVAVSPADPSVDVSVDPSGVDVTTTPDTSASVPTTGSDSDPATDASGSDDSTPPATTDPTAAAPVDSSVTASDPTSSSPGSHRSTHAHAAVASAKASARSAAKASADPAVDTAAGVASLRASHTPREWSGGGAGGIAMLSPAPKEVAVPDAVNAVLQHVAPGASWTLAREAVTGRFTLWLALLAILGVVRWALSGLVRDARRRARLVSSA